MLGGFNPFGSGGYGAGNKQSGNNPSRQQKSSPFQGNVAHDNFTLGAGQQTFSAFKPTALPKTHFGSTAVVQPAQQSTSGDQLTAFQSQLQSGEVMFRRGKNWDATKDFGYA